MAIPTGATRVPWKIAPQRGQALAVSAINEALALRVGLILVSNAAERERGGYRLEGGRVVIARPILAWRLAWDGSS
jgi:hypothetical protein